MEAVCGFLKRGGQSGWGRIFLLLFLVWLPGCFLDSGSLDSRACKEDGDCSAFGDSYVCRTGYCQEEAPECQVAEDCIARMGEPGACMALSCNGAGKCVSSPLAEGTACGEQNYCAAGVCDSSGACVYTPEDELCDNGLFCDGFEKCSPNSANADERGCVAGLPPNLEDGIACTRGECDEGTDTVSQDCSACECCGDNLGCEGEAPTCFAWSCGDSFACELSPSAEGTPCDDGVACTVDDVCNAGQQCIGSPQNSTCEDGVFCNGAEVCAPGTAQADERGCISTRVPGLDDGISCTVDTCNEEEGLVDHDSSDCACEVDADCDAPCREGSCINQVCIFGPVAVGTVCDDGLSCTSNDRCDEQLECRGTPDDLACDDGFFCNGQERCAPLAEGIDAQGCLPDAAPPLDDGVACTVDTCDEITDEVQHDDAACDCQTDDDCVATCQVGACEAGACVFSPVPVGTACDDGVACTDNDACNARQACEGTPSAALCSDGLFCNGVEVCAPGEEGANNEGCLEGEAPLVEDDIVCTVDRCDEELDQVVHDPSECPCRTDDECSQVCQTGSCVDFSCVFTPAPGALCDDGVACTVNDVCGDDLRCVGELSNALCDNGAFCDGSETCSPGDEGANEQGCLAGTPVDIDDNIECTVDSCDDDADLVLHIPQECGCVTDEDCDAPCKDGVCTDFVCVFTPHPAGTSCEDGFACTEGETCDENQQCVVETYVNARCDDGLYCTGVEFCSPDTEGAGIDGCVAGETPLEMWPDDRECLLLTCDEDAQTVSADESNCCVDGGEGIWGTMACSDGFDNDCDGVVDALDPDCAFSPALVDNLTLWLDASDGGTINGGNPGNGARVEAWLDKSGNGHHARRSRPGFLQGDKRPRWRNNRVNGRAVLEFDGWNDSMSVDGAEDFNFSTEVTIAVVFRADPFDRIWQALFTKGDNAWRVHRYGSSSEMAFGSNSANGAGDLNSQVGLSRDRYYYMLVDFNNGNKSLSLNGVLRSSAYHGSPLNSNDYAVMIGENDQMSRRYWDGFVAEIIVYENVLSVEERTGLDQYMMSRWGIAP